MGTDRLSVVTDHPAPPGIALLPLVIAEGPSQLARRNVGTPVFGGMIASAVIGIFLIPALYVLFQALRERLRPASRPAAERAPGPAE